jgi:hypothetical protein
MAAGLVVILYLVLAYGIGYDQGKRHGERGTGTPIGDPPSCDAWMS